MKKYVLSILVDNHANVMARVASLFARRRFNMSSVTAATTCDPTVSVISIVTEGDEHNLEQIIKQTRKLQEVKEVTVLPPDESLLYEMLILKLAFGEANISSLRDIVEVYRAKIIDLTSSSMVVELTGKPSKIDGFLEVMSPYNILEMCRSGIIGMSRGNQSDWWKSGR
ncbi:acetolactate synthase small subunit [uncultured Mailhella sp.]|uniref:acetolactate synthase small subunit n=1 Tax=uncultured Mailhella sp. TaxID=1981031 RepID=UPI00260A095D|nr:acetolactate synthase small subunit [uncultured Mailhella sp.]